MATFKQWKINESLKIGLEELNVLRLETKFDKNEVLKPDKKIIDVLDNYILCDAASKVSLYFHVLIGFRIN